MKLKLKELRKIAVKYKLKVLILFGSQASGKVSKNSDVDLAFYSLHKVNEQALFSDIMAVLKREDIDLVNLAKTHNHIIRYQILSKCKVIFEESKGLANNMKWQSYFDYCDFKKYYELRERLLDKKIADMVV
jgi:predicted nucleotidyltransferase